jgi:hypothetical protein
MALLHIYDSSDAMIRQTAGRRNVADQLPVADGNDLDDGINGLLAAGRYFDRVLFETHGCPGQISFGGVGIGASYWGSAKTNKLNWYRLVTNNARIYFNGCNVAEGDQGWAFLEAAADVFLNPGGGEVFAQTSVGFGNPFNGHVIHLWGDTRRIFVAADGRILERFEQ